MYNSNDINWQITHLIISIIGYYCINIAILLIFNSF